MGRRQTEIDNEVVYALRDAGFPFRRIATAMRVSDTTLRKKMAEPEEAVHPVQQSAAPIARSKIGMRNRKPRLIALPTPQPEVPMVPALATKKRIEKVLPQSDMIQLLLEGNTIQDIAAEWNFDVSTVRRYVHRLADAGKIRFA